MNWKELKDFCNSLPESELEKNVVMWREDAEDVIADISAEQLSEDHYLDPENKEDGCFPESQALSMIKMSPEDYPFGIEYFNKVYDAGHAILSENF